MCALLVMLLKNNYLVSKFLILVYQNKSKHLLKGLNFDKTFISIDLNIVFFNFTYCVPDTL